MDDEQKSQEIIEIPTERIISRIFIIRWRKVMLDRDLAELYNIKTGVLNQAVKRNYKRFSSDFMFRLSRIEMKNLKSQFVITSLIGDDFLKVTICDFHRWSTMV